MMKWLGNVFKKKIDYRELYLEEVKNSERWEFKYNKLVRILTEALEDNNKK